jgi:hypothetical protein
MGKIGRCIAPSVTCRRAVLGKVVAQPIALQRLAVLGNFDHIEIVRRRHVRPNKRDGHVA